MAVRFDVDTEQGRGALWDTGGPTNPRMIRTAHVDGRPSALSSLGVLQLLFQPLQLKDQGAFLRAQSLQHRLLLDQRLRQQVETILQLRLAAAAESLVAPVLALFNCSWMSSTLSFSSAARRSAAVTVSARICLSASTLDRRPANSLYTGTRDYEA
ncbi:hypothetical protein EYF80_025666 [Liparis tanakae]|uniref:Uncharacterized protein n=1 Tax=Liparis tanakae TaxID=230148 RepID=A0A4Z2HE59_9TELE|nr:hypothetical protein EYF80_025666 [Liparis tanakae]